MAAASLVLSIIALIFNFIPGPLRWIGLGMSVVAIILGAVGKKKTQSGAATAGLVIGIIALVIGLVLFIACNACGAAIAAAA